MASARAETTRRWLARRTSVAAGWSRGRRIARRHKAGILGGILLIALVFVAALGSTLAPYDPTEAFTAHLFAGPSMNFWLGNDELGRDVLSRLIVGTRATVVVGTLSTITAVAIGVPIGLVAGYLRGRADLMAVYLVDTVLAFPTLLLAMTLVGILSPGVTNVSIAIGVSTFPSFARLARSSAMSLRTTMFVEAARCVGASQARILLRHIFPNSVAPLIVQAALSFGFAVAVEAALSFLGVGLQPPAPTWGGMVRDGLPYLRTAPHLVFVPSAAIFLTILGSNLLGDGIRDALDPRLRGER